MHQILVLGSICALSLQAHAASLECEGIADTALAENKLGSFWHPKNNKTEKNGAIYFDNDDRGTISKTFSNKMPGVVLKIEEQATSSKLKSVITYWHADKRFASNTIGYDQNTCTIESLMCVIKDTSATVTIDVNQCGKKKQNDLLSKKSILASSCKEQLDKMCEKYSKFISQTAPAHERSGTDNPET